MKKTKTKKANSEQKPIQSQSTPKNSKMLGKEQTFLEWWREQHICEDYGDLSVMSWYMCRKEEEEFRKYLE
ncbi:MAG: hypothetical protein IPG55_16780 [Saprospiraceae bacterium]|nr:hypothetical protein [Candidatus Defluviibacterium haderslevense]